MSQTYTVTLWTWPSKMLQHVWDLCLQAWWSGAACAMQDWRSHWKLQTVWVQQEVQVSRFLLCSFWVSLQWQVGLSQRRGWILFALVQRSDQMWTDVSVQKLWSVHSYWWCLRHLQWLSPIWWWNDVWFEETKLPFSLLMFKLCHVLPWRGNILQKFLALFRPFPLIADLQFFSHTNHIVVKVDRAGKSWPVPKQTWTNLWIFDNKQEVSFCKNLPQFIWESEPQLLLQSSKPESYQTEQQQHSTHQDKELC